MANTTIIKIDNVLVAVVLIILLFGFYMIFQQQRELIEASQELHKAIQDLQEDIQNNLDNDTIDYYYPNVTILGVEFDSVGFDKFKYNYVVNNSILKEVRLIYG